ncbi:SDR family oxidoreductase [Clostridium perfringens]|nr:SDR family oxidoreductase [Clostridium perfringens]
MQYNVLDCNIMIAFHCSHYGIQEMIKQNKGGAIVNVSSVAGLTGFPGHSAYVTSKHGLNGLTRNMVLDYARYGIRVNAVNPGTTDTPMYHEALEFLKNKRESAEKAGVKIEGGIVSGKVTSPQNRVARAEEVADVILFLSSPEASNVTGIFMPVDGGFTAF